MLFHSTLACPPKMRYVCFTFPPRSILAEYIEDNFFGDFRLKKPFCTVKFGVFFYLDVRLSILDIFLKNLSRI